MEKGNQIGEQLPVLETNQNFEQDFDLEREDNSPKIEECVADEGNAEEGEPVGKFKNAKDLLEAYNNLQAEFTRKSQRLSELEKSKKPDEQTENGLRAFLSKNSEAFAYTEELKKRVSKEELHDETAFENAWTKMLYEKLSAGKEQFQNLILKDDNIKDLVIKNYLKTLQEQNVPFVMSTNSGERVTKPVTPKPDSFESAKKTVLDLFS